MNMLHHNCTAQAALDAPRFCVGAGMPDNGEGDVDGGDISSECFLEDGISEEVRDGLRAMGHDVHILSGYARGMFGRGQVS